MDNKDYRDIVEKYIDTIYKIALSYTKTPSDADDVVQQTFMKLLSKNVAFTDEEHIKRWLIRVCVNECNSLFSSFWRRNVGSYENTEKSISDRLEFSTVENMVLYDTIKELPAKFKALIYLFYYEGYPTKEIADILHINEATVRTRLVATRKLLKDKLKEAWEDE